MEVIREELVAVRDEYGDKRRTEIVASRLDLTMADLIAEEDMVVTLSHAGYAKIQPVSDYQAQRRGGKGKSATGVKDEDFVEHLLVASTHDTIMCFTSRGKVYWLTVYDIPVASRQAKGRPIVNLLPLEEGERITTLLPVKEYTEGHFVFMATSRGTVKKTDLPAFSRQRSSGLIALELDEGDTLIGAAITDGTKDVMLFSDGGKAVRFKEDEVRSMGRTARGVRGIRLLNDQLVISLIIPQEGMSILTSSERGYGKRTAVEDFPTKGRGTQGVISMVVNDRNGRLVGAVQVEETDDVMMISDQGTLVRTPVKDVSVLGRNTQGVTLIRIAEDEKLVSIERICESEEVLDAEGQPLSDDISADEADLEINDSEMEQGDSVDE
jgi:DNA gyrase subunit A